MAPRAVPRGAAPDGTVPSACREAPKTPQQPVWTGSIARPADVALAVTAFLLLQVWRLPPWRVAILSACAGAALAVAA